MKSDKNPFRKDYKVQSNTTVSILTTWSKEKRLLWSETGVVPVAEGQYCVLENDKCYCNKIRVRLVT